MTTAPTPDAFEILDPAVIEDPYPFFASLTEHAPVYRVPDTPVYLVSTWKLIDEALGRPGDFSANLTGLLIRGDDGAPQLLDVPSIGAGGRSIATADDPEHAVHRRLVQPHMNVARVAALEKEIRAQVRPRIGALVTAGAGDWTREVADPVPTWVMARIIGLPDADLDALLVWAMGGGALLAGTHDAARMAELGEDVAAMSTYLADHVERALDASHPGPDADLLHVLADAVARGEFDVEQAVGILTVLVGAGGESTSSLTGSAARILAQRADLQARLRSEPELIPRFVEEVVRLEPPFRGHYRVVMRETELGAVPLAAGARLILLWAAANRDRAEFDRPHELLLDRRVPRHHLGFGRGIHFCVGAALARLEARVMLEELLARTTRFEVDPARPPAHVSSIFVRRLAHLHLRLSA